MPQLPSLRLPALPTPLLVRRRAAAARRVLARRPWLYWLAIGSLAVAAAATVNAHATRLDTARDAWGSRVPVLVARRPIAPGEALADAVAVEQWPEALVGAALPSELSAGAVARQHIAAGEPLGRSDVVPAGGPLALVPDGWVAVPVVESPASGAAPGDWVGVVSEGVVIAEEAVVVGSVDQATLIATPADVAPLLPLAADTGRLTLLRIP